MKPRADEIRDMLLEAKDAYYNTNSPVMSDDEFDSLEDELRKLDPENPYFAFVGSSVRGAKIAHAKPMLSMQKGKTVEDVAKWMQKLRLEEASEYCVQPKIDGLSASCRYEKGQLAFVATRGDGTTGQDVTHIAKFISDIHQSIPLNAESCDIRGELYLPKNTEFDVGNRPLRNNCVGLINRKESQGDLRFVRFVAYQIEGASFRRESEKIQWLKDNGFNTVDFFRISTREELAEINENYLSSLRDEWEFETDGLIVSVDEVALFDEIDSRWVVDHHHHYAMALKPPAQERETVFRRIEWQVSRQGNIIPVAIFDPVIIGGAKIERASLSNASTVKKIALREGDTLLIERANDVIPYIKRNLSAAGGERESDQIICTCPSCGETLVEAGVHLKCPNRNCAEANIQKILFWIKQSGAEQIAEATVRTLYNAGRIKRVRDLYDLSAGDFDDIAGFAEKKIANFISEMAKTRKLSASDFISRLGIPLVQKKSLSNLGINSIEAFLAFNDVTYVIGKNIVEWKSDSENISYFDDLLSAVEIAEAAESRQRDKVCMTGKGPAGRKELSKMIEDMGYEFTDDLTKDVAILLCDDTASSSSKLVKARKLGIQITSYDDFLKNSRQ